MKVGIIGSGIVGRVLATAFLIEGNEVMLGSRNVSKDEVVKWKNENSSGKTGNFSDTAIFGDLLVLATAGTVIAEAIKLAGLKNFNGKVIIDATNPFAAAPPQNGVLEFFTSMDESLMEQIQRVIPEAKVVKAFNSVGNALMYKPDYSGVNPTMFICGNDDGAKHFVVHSWIYPQ